MGRTVTPGWRNGIRRNVRPRCRSASGSVRNSPKHQSAHTARLAHTFCPVTTQSSPSRTAFERMAARSLPASGSLHA
jgi:hypothetical protein